MRITILNGNPDAGNQAFDDYLRQLAAALQGQHDVAILDLRELDIHYCTGCFGCWVKRPGQCVVQDESARVCRAAVQSDFLLLASPLIMGFVSALLKKTNDKMLPLIHPYFAVDQGEAHHRARYERYPLLGLLLDKGPDSDDEDVVITTEIYQRTALNMKSRLAWAGLTQEPVQEVAHAIDRL
ncbi:MAG: flavodoxin family protein [Chloroflexia bacterium]|nr:flavodoxin family protein [Chloroflexia bacterium]